MSQFTEIMNRAYPNLRETTKTPKGYHIHLDKFVKLTDCCPFCGKPNKAYNA